MFAVAAFAIGCASSSSSSSSPSSSSGTGGAVHNDAVTRAPRKVAVVVSESTKADVMSALRDRGIERVDASEEHALLHDDERLAAEFGRPLRFAQGTAAQAWQDGSAVCVARAGRAPPHRNPLARTCAAHLGAVVWEHHAASLGVDAVLDVRAHARLYVPGSTQVLEGQTESGTKLKDTVAWLLSSAPPRDRVPALHLPAAPVATDPLLHGSFGAFAKNANGGCNQPLPSSLVVEGDTPMARAVENAWQALPQRPRSGPPSACRVSASAFVDVRGTRRAGGWLDCAPPLLPVAVLLDAGASDSASTGGIAELLVDRAVTDFCKYER